MVPIYARHIHDGTAVSGQRPDLAVIGNRPIVRGSVRWHERIVTGNDRPLYAPLNWHDRPAKKTAGDIASLMTAACDRLLAYSIVCALAYPVGMALGAWYALFGGGSWRWML